MRTDPERDLLAAGGDSVSATRLATRVRDRFGVDLPVAACLTQSITQQAQRIAERLAEAPAGPAEIAPRRLPRDAPLPLAPAQRRLWYLDQLFRPEDGQPEGDVSYNMRVTVRFETFDRYALQHSLDEITRRHEVLRTRLVNTDGTPWQHIDAPRSVPIETVDLSSVPAKRRRDAMLESAEEHLRRPFDLARDLMLRAVDLDLGDGEHLILLVMHHVASDGWSIGILLRELATLYAEFRGEGAGTLPDLAFQYADLAHWQEAALARREPQLLDFWRTALAGAPQTLELPLDHPRSSSLSDRGASLDWRLNAAQRNGLDTLAGQRGATLFSTLIAAFGVLLFRISGQQDLLLSVPAANRMHSASEPLIGFFTNMLVVRLRTPPGHDFATLLAATHDACCAAVQHQDLPFDQLVADLQPDRQQGQTPFVQTGFALQNAFGSELETPGLEVETLPLHTGTSHFDFSLSMTETPDQIDATFEYRSELFEPTTIQRLAHSLRALVDGLLANPQAPISDLPILRDAGRHQLLIEGNDTACDFDLEGTVHQLVEAQIARTPQAECARFAGSSLTYRQLGRRAGRLAERLRTLGVGPEVTVGVLLERSLELPVALLAVLQAGGACVPLAPDLPPQRLGLILADTSVAVVITQAGLVERLPKDFAGVSLDIHQALRPKARDASGGPAELALAQPSPAQLSPDNLGYVIYTSGSTGRPKGVRMHHRGLRQRLLWQQHDFPLTPKDRVLQNLSIGFDAAFWQIFGPLIAGATIVLPRPGGHMDTAYLAELIAGEGVTCADFVPSVLSQMLEAPALARCDALRQIVSGGEALHASLAARLFERLPAIRLVNIYGPTETSLTIASQTLDASATPQPITIGRPISNTSAYVMDPRARQVAIGVAGEIYAGGVGITGGYLGRPALTAEKFVPNPFRGSGERLYRTGDLARLRADGSLDFLGRVDHQVKVRGVRMELGEIEAELSRQDGVLEAAVLARDDVPGAAPGEKRLVAYVVAADPSLSPANLRHGLGQQLPPTMVPGIYLMLPAMPLSVNGKIDRSELPAPDASTKRRIVPPRNSVESELAELWQQTLNPSELSIHDNFFDLGGHSLLAVRLMASVQEHFDIELDLAALYAAGTVAEMAKLLRAPSDEPIDAAPTLGPAPLRDPAPFRDPASSTLVTLRRGTGSPLILVHAVDGSADPYRPLAAAMPGEHPVYGLQAPELEASRFERLEALAEHHAECLLDAHSDDPFTGPFTLGGWSAGGLLACEIARWLEREGHAVQVVLLDTHPAADRDLEAEPEPEQARLLFAHQWLGGTEAELRGALELPTDPADPPVADEAFLGRLATRISERPEALARPEGSELAQRWRTFLGLFEAGQRYRPQPHGCPLTLIRAADAPVERMAQQERDCRALSRLGLEIHTVPGGHRDVLRPPAVAAVADILDAVTSRTVTSRTVPSQTVSSRAVSSRTFAENLA
ncbi:MAG: amino acid adenylation domain-containing protein [Acidobacteriota bacterium]